MKFQHISLARFLAVITIICGGATFLSVHFYDRLSSGNQLLNKMNAGAEICFSRVTQTFNAAAFGTASASYVQKDFTTSTGECFAELQRMTSQQKVEAAINEVNSRLYWFHDEILALLKFSDGDSIQGSLNPSRRASLINKYERVEEAKYQVNGLLENKIRYNETWVSITRIATYLITSLYLLLTSYYLIARYRRVQRLARIEKRSFDVMIQNTVQEVSGVFQIISDALRASDLHITREVFQRYQQFQEERMIIQPQLFEQEKVKADDPKIQEKEVVKEDKESIFDKIFEEEELLSDYELELGQEEDAKQFDFELNLSNCVSRIIELHSPNIFKSGVIVNFNVRDSLFLGSENEEFSTAVESLMATTLSYGVKYLHGQTLSVADKIEEDCASVRVSISGHKFSDDELLWTTESSQDIDLDLLLVHELAQDIECDIQLENSIAPNGSSMASINLRFHHFRVVTDLAERSSVDTSSEKVEKRKRLVQLFKGKKKDLKSEIEQHKPLEA